MDREERAPGPPWEALLETLRELLPDAADFRAEQKPVIERIMDGRDVLAVMPTGGGKSVCYQVPAMHLPGITLVVSPLIALMEDQVKRLLDRGFPAACLSSGFIACRGRGGVPCFRYADEDGEDGEARSKSFRALRNDIFLAASHGEYKLLYVTPERLRNGQFIRFAQRVRISMIAVDEAHCISLWGYDFRPRYLEISRLLTRIGYHPIIAAFTATATRSVREDIAKLLGMHLEQPEQPAGPGDGGRGNLRFSVRHISEAKGMKKRELLRFLQQHRGSSGFVYCSKVEYVNDVWQYLKGKGVAVTRYFAGLDKERNKEKDESRQKNLGEFLSGKKTVMVSTTALGMGIDKRDIRFVVHYNLPVCLENYYQEAGRAGRDGLPAECVLYYDAKEDVQVCRGLINSAVEHSELSKDDRKLHREAAEKRLKRMIEYAERGKGQDSAALHQRILGYFHEFDPRDKPSEPEMLSKIKRIDVLYANRTKIAQELRKGRMEGKDLTVGKGLTVSYCVTGGTLGYFDLMVADAVYTLMKHRVPTIYAKTVMELLSGNEKLLLRPERKAEVENSIRKMIETNIVIDRTASSQYGFAYDDQRGKLMMRGAFLPLYEKKNGFGYDAGALPPLYEYAEILNGQFFTFPARYLRAGLPAAPENLAMAHYLLCRIDMSSSFFEPKRRTATSRTLRFDTMIKTLGIGLPEGKWYRERKLKSLWEEKMIPLLRHFQDVGVLKRFDEDIERGRITFYRFIPKEKQKTDNFI